MATSEERMKILKMVQDGKITADQAAELLKALESRSAPAGQPGAPGQATSAPGTRQARASRAPQPRAFI